MADNFGVSFQPSDANQGPQQQPHLQEAIQLLNLRLPSIIGARSPIPQALLTAPGLVKQGGTDVEFIKQLLGLNMPAQSPAGGPQLHSGQDAQRPNPVAMPPAPGAPPPPRVTPGQEPGSSLHTQRPAAPARPARPEMKLPRQQRI